MRQGGAFLGRQVGEELGQELVPGRGGQDVGVFAGGGEADQAGAAVAWVVGALDQAVAGQALNKKPNRIDG
ncbi:hypothetical protein ACQEVZ_11390 [Dactylosporangium sp. CA-152071]|uniref:hypothetical protein n=1 Tax=Dactylosporangium sp. CA-152071 TaxID=3239933 RepID=UPI003D90C79A